MIPSQKKQILIAKKIVPVLRKLVSNNKKATFNMQRIVSINQFFNNHLRPKRTVSRDEEDEE